MMIMLVPELKESIEFITSHLIGGHRQMEAKFGLPISHAYWTKDALAACPSRKLT